MNLRSYLFRPTLILAILSVLLFARIAQAQPATIWSWCMSNPSERTIYFTEVFDSGMNQKATFNGLSLGRQFAEYAKGRLEIGGNASCGTGVYQRDKAEVSQRRQAVIDQLRRQNKQIIELPDWNYIRDDVAIKASFAVSGKDYVYVEGTQPNDHIYCISDTFQNTVYYAEPMKMADPSRNPSVPYFRMLLQKYGFKGQQICPILNEPHTVLYLKARLDGARAAGKKIVNTGWPQASSETMAQTTPKDDDPEPARRSSAIQPSPSASVRDIAAKEVSPAIALCQKSRAQRAAYECSCLQTQIYSYRIAHPAETVKSVPLLAAFFDGKLLEYEKCLTDSRAKMEARDMAGSAGLTQPSAKECVADKFVALVHARPVPSLAESEMQSAIKACR